MCLFSKKIFNSYNEIDKFKKNLPIIKKNITVYKILNKDNKSPYRGFKYEQGFHYTESSFNIQSFQFFNYSPLKVKYRVKIFRGLHVFKKLKQAKTNLRYDDKIVKMIIPKDSVYIEGINGDIVTNNLIWY